MADPDSEPLEYIVNHVILPLKLPACLEPDDLRHKAEQALMALLCSSLRTYVQSLPRSLKGNQGWLIVEKMLAHLRNLNSSPTLSTDLLIKVISSLKNTDVITIPLRAQNAVLTIRMTQNSAKFECFENSPQATDVLASKGGLVRHFPARALAIPSDTFRNENFQQQLVAKLALLDSEEVLEMVNRRSHHGVARNTTDPSLVTDMLFALLGAVGKPVEAKRLIKRTRDEVFTRQDASPWRRSALWLTIRIAIQSTLCETSEEPLARIQYKNIILYFLSEIACQAAKKRLEDELCQMIIMKIARRANKLGTGVQGFVGDRATDISRTISETNKSLWHGVCRRDGDRSSGMGLRDFRSDTALRLENSGKYLQSVFDRDTRMLDALAAFKPACPPWLQDKKGLRAFVNLHSLGKEAVYALGAFEDWISSSLDSWTVTCLPSPKAYQCIVLARLADDYHRQAQVTYANIPLMLSNMIVTILHIWYAVDQLAVKITPFLKEITPTINTRMFEVLLLPKQKQMATLHAIERYIHTRHVFAKGRDPSIFNDPAKSSAFTVQYFARSLKAQKLRRQIETDAQAKLDQHRKNWEELSAKFKELMSAAMKLSCEASVEENSGIEHDVSTCQKCQLIDEAEKMTIEIFEWPLPEDARICSSIAVELDLPLHIAAWRNLTWLLIHRVGRQGGTSGKFPESQLSSYFGFKDYYKTCESHLTLGSKVKSRVANGEKLKFPIEFESCHVPNGLKLELLDVHNNCWIATQMSEPSLVNYCRPILPDGMYTNLQYAINSCEHSQNKVIALQQLCPRDMHLTEFLSFGSLRADGERVQWLNIKRELGAANLSLNAPEICTLICQAAWQAGSAASCELRDSHLDLNSTEFAQELLKELERRFLLIHQNWKSDHAMGLLISLALRVLSLAPSDDIVGQCLDFLSRIRQQMQEWMKWVATVILKTKLAKQVDFLATSLLRSALLCKRTFEVDLQHVAVTVSTASNLKAWSYASIQVCDNSPGNLDNVAPSLRNAILHDKRLSQSLQAAVSKSVIIDASDGLDQAIGAIIDGHVSLAGSWTALAAPNDRWIVAESPNTSTVPQRVFHYDLLEGGLLVNGKAMGRLPLKYTAHELYTRVFGSQVLPVVSGEMASMEYQTVQPINGYLIYFAMVLDQLVIRAEKDSQLLELVPNTKFGGDIPSMLIEDYTHWLDIYSQKVESRPLKAMWTADVEGWQLQYRQRSKSTLLKGRIALLDMSKMAHESVMAVFGPLDSIEHICATYDLKSRVLVVYLHRYDLHFILQASGEFLCKEIGKIVDSDQSLGTLIGLKSRLILCGTSDHTRRFDRIVLIPEGDELLLSRANSERIIVIQSSGPSVKYYLYSIEPDSQRLKGSNDPHGLIFKAFLHASTAHFLPDPLLGLTGTEVALTQLRQRSLSFSVPPGDRATKWLQSISKLTPKIKHHPPTAAESQEITWHPSLPTLSQHADFVSLANRIVTSGNAFAFLYIGVCEAPSLLVGRDAHLLDRLRVKQAVYRGYNIGGCRSPRNYEAVYAPRDRTTISERAEKCYEMGLLVVTPSRALEVSSDLYKDWKGFGEMNGFNTTFNPSSKTLAELLNLRFCDAWGPLQGLMSSLDATNNSFEIFFLMGILAYGSGVEDLTSLKTLLAFVYNPKLRNKVVPYGIPFLNFNKGFNLTPGRLDSVLSKYFPKVSNSARLSRPKRAENDRFRREIPLQKQLVYDYYSRQWPVEIPEPPPDSLADLFPVEDAHPAVARLFEVLTANSHYRAYCHEIQPILISIRRVFASVRYLAQDWHLNETQDDTLVPNPIPSLGSLMATHDAPALSLSTTQDHQYQRLKHDQNPALALLLDRINVADDPTGVREKYRLLLKASHQNLLEHKTMIMPTDLLYSSEDIYHVQIKEHLDSLMSEISDALKPKDVISRLLELSGLWPCYNFQCLLKLLAEESNWVRESGWKKALLTFGLCASALQRARRLLRSCEANDISKFHVDMENSGHQGWDVEAHPQWLLMELENDFLIRPMQAQVAMEMINPSSGTNTLVQLNMGEGKSSVIVPLVAITNADRHCLSRIVVLKSLSKQMKATFIQRLGGMLDRRVVFMPFSRKISMDGATAKRIQGLLERCLQDGDVLLAHPEHILSFRLMGIERLIANDMTSASQLIRTQVWLDKHARDLLDESDEVLDVKFQQIYSLGTPKMMDGQPGRWTVIQSLLDVVKSIAPIIAEDCPCEIEVSSRARSNFPTIKILTPEAGQRLISRLQDGVMDSCLKGLSFENAPSKVKMAARAFIRERHVDNDSCQWLTAHYANRDTDFQILLQLRGLLSQGILLYVLQGLRWLVHYGLHLSRGMLAVPYRAKGVPAPSAEFGHPDVAILLTCLSYYFSGLTSDQVFKATQHLERADDPSREYASWIDGCEDSHAPPSSWASVNIEDDHQFHNLLVPSIRYSKNTIDYYLTSIVFPKEGKEFNEKLSTSGWDIPASGGPHHTTGFSGTNDNQFCLPLSIQQQELPQLSHTSAMVIHHVLKDSNLGYFCFQTRSKQQVSARAFLKLLQSIDTRVNVIIDVGAQILDCQNREFVEAWMKVREDATAGIFFDEDDNAMVLNQDRKEEKLSQSSFRDRMKDCLVYMDEVHTRGTDLDLPEKARAAVTLGPHLTKDRLVQACMRLRKLADHQSLLYVAPPEVNRDLVEYTGKTTDAINGLDVVAWCLENSCRSIENAQTLRVLQGLNHCRRRRTMRAFLEAHGESDTFLEVDSSSSLVSAFREKEEQTLMDLYAPPCMKPDRLPTDLGPFEDATDAREEELLAIWKALRVPLGNPSSLSEEHEREVSHEVEEETQIERPPKVEPLARAVDPNLAGFIASGTLDEFIKFPLAYDVVIKNTSIKKLINTRHPWNYLWVTRDFARTVQKPASGLYDNYLRPVNFLLTHRDDIEPNRALVISPWEANTYLREIQKPTSHVTLHVYEPRVARSMQAVDFGKDPPPPSMAEWQDLQPSLRREINLFAGQLYCNTYDDYMDLKQYLARVDRNAVDQTLHFVRAWLAIRRMGQDFAQTHVGSLVSGRTIQPGDFV